MKALVDYLIIAILLTIPFQTSYAEEEQKKSDDSSIKVIVTASRGAAEDPLDVPQSVDSVTSEELAKKVHIDLDDAIRKLPGISLAPAEGNPNYWQEGFSIRGLGAQRVLTLTDGVRQAGQGIGYGGGNLSLYDPLSVESIEVVRGPGSVLYGTDAFGGVINIITREPTLRDEPGYSGAIRYSYDASRDMNRGGTYLDAGDEDFALVFGTSYSDVGEPNLPSDMDPMGGSYENFGFWGKAEIKIDENQSFRLIGNMDKNSDVLVLDDAIVLPIATFPPPGGSTPVFSPLYFEFPEYNRGFLGLEYIAENLSDSWDRLQSGVYWQQISRKFHRETAFYPTGSPGFAGPPLFIDPSASVTRSIVNTDDETNTIEWQTQSRHTFGDHSVTFGLDVGLDDADLPESEAQFVAAVAGAGIVPPAGPSFTRSTKRADAEQIRAGFYAQDRIELGDFEVIPGARVDYYGVDDNESNFDDDEFGASGSLGTVYHATAEHSVYSTLATGFRAPDLGERFQSGVVNLGAPTQIIGKEDLDPERSWSAEVGAKGRTGKVSYGVAGYYNYVEDFIGLVDRGMVGGLITEQYDNVGDVALYGTEAYTSVSVTDQIEFFANAYRTWTDEETKVDVADWVFNYGVKFAEQFTESFLQGLETGIVARSILESEDKTPTAGRDSFDAASFTVVDLFLNLDIHETETGQFQVVTGVRNIFDKKYQEPFFPMYQPERSAYAGVQFNF